jgi:hypothetical protein
MSKKLDTSWFHLKNYEGLKDLDTYGWYRQLVIRGRIKSLLLTYDDIIEIEREDLNDSERSEIYEAITDRELLAREWAVLHAVPALRWIERIKSNPIIDSNDSDVYKMHESQSKYPFNTYSITSTSAWNMYLIANDDQLSDVWKYCDILYEEIEVTEKQGDLIETPYDLLAIDRGILENKGLAHVTVDLTATDEQIRQDFCHWLTEYRRATKFGPKNKKQQKFFTSTDLSNWEEERLLPYIDLMLISKIEGKKINNPDMAKLIYSDKYSDKRSDLDFTDKVRRTIHKKAVKLIRQKTLAAIEAQLHSKSPNRSKKEKLKIS